jgi:hypothetical protein
VYTVRTGTVTKAGMNISDLQAVMKQQLRSTARLVQNFMVKERYQFVQKG